MTAFAALTALGAYLAGIFLFGLGWKFLQSKRLPRQENLFHQGHHSEQHELAATGTRR